MHVIAARAVNVPRAFGARRGFFHISAPQRAMSAAAMPDTPPPNRESRRTSQITDGNSSRRKRVAGTSNTTYAMQIGVLGAAVVAAISINMIDSTFEQRFEDFDEISRYYLERLCDRILSGMGLGGLYP